MTGAPTGHLAVSVLSISSIVRRFFERLAKSGHDDRVCVTRRWREMDSNFWYRGTKAVDFRSIPGIAGVSAGLLNDTT